MASRGCLGNAAASLAPLGLKLQIFLCGQCGELGVEKNLKCLLHLVRATLPEFRAPFHGKLKAELIGRQAAETSSSAEQVRGVLGVLLNYLSDRQYSSSLAQGDNRISFHLHSYFLSSLSSANCGCLPLGVRDETTLLNKNLNF